MGLYDPRGISEKVDEAGVAGKKKSIQMAQIEVDRVDEEERKDEMIKNKLIKKKMQKAGQSKYAEINRLFHRNKHNDNKVYTDRYVRRLKAAHKKLIEKFALGSKYALVA